MKKDEDTKIRKNSFEEGESAPRFNYDEFIREEIRESDRGFLLYLLIKSIIIIGGLLLAAWVL